MAAQWAAVWNKAHDECMGKDGAEEKACEEMAFKMANGMMKEEAAPAPQTAVLIEQLELVEGTLNPEKKQVEVVLIRPGWSKNGRYYSPAVLTKAAPLFEGVKAYANHPAREDLIKGIPRDVRDITGDYTGVHLGPQGEVRATRTVYGVAGEAVWPLIQRAVETKRDVIGVSINAVGKAAPGQAEGRDGLIVEDITHANSADDVDAPAAGGKFETLMAGDLPALTRAILEALSYEEFIAARPEYLDRVRDQMKRARQDEAVRAALMERDQAHSELVKAQTENKRLKAQAIRHRTELQEARQLQARTELLVALELALREARLPAEYEQDVRERLPALPPADWPAMIDRERRKAQAVGAKPTVPVDGAPRLTEAAPLPASPPTPLPLPHESYAEWAQRVGSAAGKVRLLP
jgi:hypothetical protein